MAIFSVATSPFDSKTTKRPFALMSLEPERNPVGDEVNCIAKGSGVALGVWAGANVKAPKTSVSTTKAHKEQRACFTKSSETKDADRSRLDAHGSLSRTRPVKYF